MSIQVSNEDDFIEGMRGKGIIVRGCEEIGIFRSSDLKILIDILNDEKITFVLLVDKSKANDNEKLERNLSQIDKSTINRRINIREGTTKSFINLIIKELQDSDYELSSQISKQSIMQYYKSVFGEELRVSLVSQIAKQIIFQHELSSGGSEIKGLPSVDSVVIENTEKSKSYMVSELDSLIGLNVFKENIRDMVALHKLNEVRKSYGMKAECISRNIVLKGNPGTGKTTLARTLSKVLKREGLLDKDEIVEVSRDDLVGKYVGWTAKTITEYFDSAKGGILFIDEAYLLATDFENGYGEEAIGTLVKNMENYRDEVMVILAGYPNEMDRLISSNPGMESRIGIDITIDDYEPEELLQIFLHFCNENRFVCEKKAIDIVKDNFIMIKKFSDDNFGNGRYVRKIFEKIKMKQALRLSMMEEISESSLNEIIIDDVEFLAREEKYKLSSKKTRIGF